MNKDNEQDRNTNEKKFKANCKEDYEKIKIYLFASFKCYFANVMKNGYVQFDKFDNMEGDLLPWVIIMTNSQFQQNITILGL